VEAGSLAPEAIAGITTASPEEAESYRGDHGLPYPIYTDVEQKLEHDYGVTGLPYEVVVGASGRIQSTNVNIRRRIDVADLKRQMTR
jgi:peroxiredoxin